MKAIVFVAIVLIGAALATNEEKDNFKCTVGVRYKENKCNGCWCDSEDGAMSCTLMACQTHEDPKLTNCEKGTTWTEGCEQCWCTGMGTLCTQDCGKVHEALLRD